MKTFLFVSLVILSGCGIARQSKWTITNPNTSIQDEPPITGAPGIGYSSNPVNERTNPLIHYNGISNE